MRFDVVGVELKAEASFIHRQTSQLGRIEADRVRASQVSNTGTALPATQQPTQATVGTTLGGGTRHHP